MFGLTKEDFENLETLYNKNIKNNVGCDTNGNLRVYHEIEHEIRPITERINTKFGFGGQEVTKDKYFITRVYFTYAATPNGMVTYKGEDDMFGHYSFHSYINSLRNSVIRWKEFQIKIEEMGFSFKYPEKKKKNVTQEAK